MVLPFLYHLWSCKKNFPVNTPNLDLLYVSSELFSLSGVEHNSNS